MMGRRMKASLDRYITGNYGEDSVTEELVVETTSYGTAYLEFDRYAVNDRVCIRLMSEEDDSPIAVLTINIPEVELKPEEFIIKNWSENEEIAQDCWNSGLFESTGMTIRTGFVSAPVWRLKPIQE